MKIAPLKVSLFILITLSIITILMTFLGYKNILNLLGSWSQSNKMNIYLKVDSTEDDARGLTEIIKKNPAVSDINLVDRTVAGRTFQKSLSEFSSGLITEDEMIDLIPVTLEVDLQKQLGLAERDQIFSELQQQIKDLPQIDEIAFSAGWLKKFESADRIIRSFGVFIFLILLVSISYLIALMIKAFIEESKQEIEVYSLLGATRWSIYNYFLKDILVFLSSSVVASFILMFLFFVLIKNKLLSSGLSRVLADNLTFLSLGEATAIVLIVFLIIFANAYLTIQSSVNKLNQLSHE